MHIKNSAKLATDILELLNIAALRRKYQEK